MTDVYLIICLIFDIGYMLIISLILAYFIQIQKDSTKIIRNKLSYFQYGIFTFKFCNFFFFFLAK